MNRLTIFWYDNHNDYFYWTQSEDQSGESSAIHQLESHRILKADLACLADNAAGKKVELVIASSDIHFSDVNLPNKAQRHLRKAVPFLIEEKLAGSIEDNFIAIGDRKKDDMIPVRAVDRDYFESILARFNSAEIRLDAVWVDLDLLKTPASGSLVLIEQQDILISEKSGEKWRCDRDDFGWLAQKRQADKSEDETGLPIAIPLTVVCQTNDEYQHFVNNLPVGVFAPQAQLIDSIEEHLSQSGETGVNLLQAEFEVNVENTPLKKLLLKLAAIAALILVTFVVYQSSQLFYLNEKLAQLTEQREKLRKQAFPNKRRINDNMLKQAMASISGGDGENTFLTMLQSVTGQISSLQLLYPTNISYELDKNELRMDLVATNLTVLNQYRDDLILAGHQVEMSSASQRGEGYSSRLIITK